MPRGPGGPRSVSFCTYTAFYGRVSREPNTIFYRKHYRRAFYGRLKHGLQRSSTFIEGESRSRLAPCFRNRATETCVVFICFCVRHRSNIATPLIIHTDKSIIIGQTTGGCHYANCRTCTSLVIVSQFISYFIIFPFSFPWRRDPISYAIKTTIGVSYPSPFFFTVPFDLFSSKLSPERFTREFTALSFSRLQK